MAREESVNRLRIAVETVPDPDKENPAIFRAQLGPSSLSEGPLRSLLAKFREKGRFAVSHAADASENAVLAATTLYERVGRRLNEISRLDHDDYISKASDYIKAIDDDLAELGVQWPSFIAAAVETSGMLDFPAVQKTLDHIAEMSTQVESAQNKANQIVAAMEALSAQAGIAKYADLFKDVAGGVPRRGGNLNGASDPAILAHFQ